MAPSMPNSPRRGTSFWRPFSRLRRQQSSKTHEHQRRPSVSRQKGKHGDVELAQRPCSSVTVHGFRATFKSWAADKTDCAREVIEAALAHVIGDKAEQAYVAVTR
jgi:integrase